MVATVLTIGKSTIVMSGLTGSTILGGAGADTIAFLKVGNGITVDGGLGADSIYLQTGKVAYDVLGGSGADTINLIGTKGKVSQQLTIDGGAGNDVIYIQAAANSTNVVKTAAGSTAILGNVKVASGDKIVLTTKNTAWQPAATKVNFGQGVASFYVLTSLSKATGKGGNAGNTEVGNVYVFDTDGTGGSDGDLLIGFNTNGAGTKASAFTFINIVGGDALLKTTKVGNVTYDANNLGVTFSVTNKSVTINIT